MTPCKVRLWVIRDTCALNLLVLHILIYKIKLFGRGGLWDCQMMRIPRCLDIRLRGSGEVSALCTGCAFLRRNICFLFVVLIPVRG
jgi:hypothetical protein